MNLLFIRHAIAEKREEWNDLGRSDFFRPITRKGIVRFTDVTLGLSLFNENIDKIISSQLTRSVQTAEILHAKYSKANLIFSEDLNANNSPSEAIKMFSKYYQEDPEQTIAIVGHQPELAQMISLLLIGKSNINIRIKKGGIASMDYRPKKSELKWLMSGRQLVEFSAVYESLNCT